VKRVVFASLSQHQGQPGGPHATLARSAAGGFSIRAHVHNFFFFSQPQLRPGHGIAVQAGSFRSGKLAYFLILLR